MSIAAAEPTLERTPTFDDERAPSDQNQYLTFLVAGELFAIRILVIREIIEFPSVAAVPMMPSWIRGVINLRGAVVPVLDLAARLGKAAGTAGRRSCIIIVELQADGEQHVVGMVVEGVNRVLDIPAGEIEAPPVRSDGGRDFIQGLGKVDGKFVLVLDVNQLLSAEALDAAENRVRAAETLT